jgi:hypothetical protein
MLARRIRGAQRQAHLALHTAHRGHAAVAMAGHVWQDGFGESNGAKEVCVWEVSVSVVVVEA